MASDPGQPDKLVKAKRFKCDGCGAELSPTARFCPECAHPTGIAAAPVAEPRVCDARALSHA